MLVLGQFAYPRLAQALVDYLHTQDIACRVNALTKNDDAEDLLYEVIVVDKNDFQQAALIAEDFCRDPNQDKYLNAAWQRNEALPKVALNGAGVVNFLIASSPLTLAVLILIIVLQVLVEAGAGRALIGFLHFPQSLAALDFTNIHRLFTPILLHGDWAHLVFNALWWFWLGNKIEKHAGALHLINVTLFTALVAHVAQFALVGANFIGLSGVVYGLFAYVWLIGRWEKVAEYHIPNQLIGMLLLWMVIGFADVLWVNMANWAHLFGFIGGCLFAFFAKSKKVRK